MPFISPEELAQVNADWVKRRTECEKKEDFSSVHVQIELQSDIFHQLWFETPLALSLVYFIFA